MNYTQTKKHTFAQLVRRKRTYWNKHRKSYRNPRKDVKLGSIVEGCDLHIGQVIEIDLPNGDIKVKSFFTGKEGYCDLYHCGVRVQTTKQIIQKLALYREGGIEAIKNLWDERVRKRIY